MRFPAKYSDQHVTRKLSKQ